jgi:hypothetical protein
MLTKFTFPRTAPTALAAVILVLALRAHADTNLTFNDSMLPSGSTGINSFSWGVTNSGSAHFGSAAVVRATFQDIPGRSHSIIASRL